MPREGNLAYQVAKRHQATGAHDVSTVPLQGQFSSVITFRVRRVRGEMHIGHGRLSVCLSVPRRIPTLLHGSRCNFGENGRECPLVVHYWADLQSVHGFRCYNNIHVCELIALYTEHAYSAQREMSASACIRCMPG